MTQYVYDLIEGYYLFNCECDNTHENNNTVCRYCFAINNPDCSDYEIVDKKDYDRLQEYKNSKWAKWENKHTL